MGGGGKTDASWRLIDGRWLDAAEDRLRLCQEEPGKEVRETCRGGKRKDYRRKKELMMDCSKRG